MISSDATGIRKYALVCLVLLAPAPAVAQENIEEDALNVLNGMSGTLLSLDKFSVATEIELELVDLQGQKLQFISSGNIEVQRPGNMRISRKGAVIDAEVYLSNSLLTIYGKNINAYMQFPQQESIDQAVELIETTLDFDAAGADFLGNNPYERLLAGTTSGVHVGMTVVQGQPAHHLAFRTDLVDWQIWVADSASPLPLKYTVTSKWITGSPQYSIRFTNWNTNAEFDAATFEFQPEENTSQVEVITTDSMGNILGGQE